jgi:DNA-binding MarR family transcriptional regulator
MTELRKPDDRFPALPHQGANVMNAPQQDGSLLNDDLRASAKALRLALEPFLDVRPVMSISRLIAFLMVVENEGRTMTEYARDADVRTTVMVKELVRLSSRLINDQPGPGLLERRRDAVNVTEKGRALLDRIGKLERHDD